MTLFDPKTKKLRELIKSRIEHGPKGCWNWKGALDQAGYARLNYGKESLGHRVSFIAWNGRIPDGLNVLHECDNRRCLNPMHLFTGTQKQNVEDCIKKGRRASFWVGKTNPASKLSEEIAREIKNSSLPAKHFIAKYKINRNTVSQIRTGVTWRNV